MTPPEPAQDSFNTRHLNLPSEEAPGILSATGPLDLQRPWVIEFRVVGTATTVKARVSDAMILGRSDSTNGYIPEVDLTPFDAFGKGVSRKHAVMTIKDQRLMLRDLNSTNGTRLNNVVCAPGEEYRVRHGNELTLGTLRLQVSFAVVPAFTDTQHGGTLKETVRALSHAAGKRLLVVESDPDVGNVLKTALENVGYKVTLVNDVVKGFGVVFQGMPDGIVLDMMEPDTNALDLIRFVRKQKSPQHVPILAVSGALAGFQMNQALSAGADSFLGKPVSVEALLESVAKAWTLQPQPALLGGMMTTGRLETRSP
jgi:CheY-like chemotaxis protein